MVSAHWKILVTKELKHIIVNIRIAHSKNYFMIIINNMPQNFFYLI
jgi:hypothetical protein